MAGRQHLAHSRLEQTNPQRFAGLTNRKPETASMTIRIEVPLQLMERVPLA